MTDLERGRVAMTRIQRSRLIEMDINTILKVVLVFLSFVAGLWIGTILN